MEHISNTYLRARYAETDKMGIVHHSRYYPWFEIARADYIRELGISYAQMEEEGLMLPLSETWAKYLCGVKYDEEVKITCTLSKLTVARCEFTYEVIRLTDNKLMTKGKTTHGFCDTSLKPVNLCKKFPKYYELLKSVAKTV